MLSIDSRVRFALAKHVSQSQNTLTFFVSAIAGSITAFANKKIIILKIPQAIDWTKIKRVIIKFASWGFGVLGFWVRVRVSVMG